MGTQTAAAGAATPKVEDSSQGYLTGYGSPTYRSYVLNALLIIYILSFMDRALLSVVARPLKAEIAISDLAFGLLTGAGFAIFYTIVGIPLARMSERKNRVWIIGISLAIWSAFTALTGFSADVVIGGTVVMTGFMALLICRIGVGVGEAGCTPPANSLIADYYPAAKRSSALGYYAMGVTLGTMLANIVGGQITDIWGWRWAFIVMGVPGIVIAIFFVLTIKEPPRGYSEVPDAKKSKKQAELWPSVREMFSKTSFWSMTAGATLAAFCGYAIAGFQSLYLQRTFALSAGEASLWVNAPAYAAGALGTVITGWLAMKMRAKSITAIAWLPAIGLATSVPFYVWGFTTTSLLMCGIGLSLGHFVKYGYLAAQYTISQGVVSPTVRATSTAVMLFIINILGYGLGPPFAGLLSDFFFQSQAAAAGFPGFTNAGCDAAAEAIRTAGGASANVAEVLAGMARPITEAQYAFCGPANSSATQTSMLVISALYAVSGVCFLLCMFTLKKDMIIVPREYENTAPISLRILVLAMGVAGLALAWLYRPAGMAGDALRMGSWDQIWFWIIAGLSALIAAYGAYVVAVHMARKRQPAAAA